MRAGGAERGGAGQCDRSRAGSPWERCILPCYGGCVVGKTTETDGAVTLVMSLGAVTHVGTKGAVTQAITRCVAQYRTRAMIGS